jgi:uncharacterized protein YjbJ (UPF0337 family)
MNDDLSEARWQEVCGQTRKYWGKLTDADLQKIEGRSERLADALQERYGYIRMHAESQSKRWMRDHQDTPAAEL